MRKSGQVNAAARDRFSRNPSGNRSFAWSERTRLIWDPHETETHFEQPRNSFCHFRKSFALTARSGRAELRIFADSRYQLFVNGHYAGRGPCRSDPRHQYFDTWDIARFLVTGTNVIAVLAVHFGYGTGQSIHRIPALAVEAEVTTQDGGRVWIHSDDTWKCCPAYAYSRTAPRINGCQGPIEVFDAGRGPHGWTEIGHDDTDWRAAKGRGTRLSPFWNWHPRDIPLLEETTVAARAVVGSGTLVEQPRPVEELHHQIKAEEASIELENRRATLTADFVVDATPHGQARLVTIDLESVEVGYFQLEVTGCRGDIVDAVFAEELWDGKALIQIESNRPIDRFILSGGPDRLESAFAWRAFRYVQLRVRNPRGSVTIHRAGLRTRRYPMARTATLESSDERLTRIWDMSARTMQLCMQDGFLDSSSREQQQWMGDGRWQALINGYYSADHRLHRKLLEQVGQSQDSTGMTRSRYPDGHHNYPPIPSFCLAWVCSFADYHRSTGDNELIAAWWPNLVHAIRWFTAYENADGLLEDVPYWSFIDWGEGPEGPVPDDQRNGILTALNLQYLEALHAMTRLARLVGDLEAIDAYQQRAAGVERSVTEHLWDSTRGAYPDCKVNGVFSRTISEPTNALAVLHLHDRADPRAAEIRQNVFAPQARGEVVAGSPYFMLVIGRALAKLDASDRALELIKERYGAMLDAGSGTTWERWTLFHRDSSGGVVASSASHAWGASPIVFVFESIFGIEPCSPGFRRFSLRPCPNGIEEIRASLPIHSGGSLEMELHRTGPHRYLLKIAVPDTCSGSLYGREMEPGSHRLLIDTESEEIVAEEPIAARPGSEDGHL